MRSQPTAATSCWAGLPAPRALLAGSRILFFEPRGSYFWVPTVTRDFPNRASEHDSGRYRPDRCHDDGASDRLICTGPTIALHSRDREGRNNEADCVTSEPLHFEYLQAVVVSGGSLWFGSMAWRSGEAEAAGNFSRATLNLADVG